MHMVPLNIPIWNSTSAAHYKILKVGVFLYTVHNFTCWMLLNFTQTFYINFHLFVILYPWFNGIYNLLLNK